jgi:uncharacterized protein with HEPN domain
MSVSNIELIKHIFDECDFISIHTIGKDSNQVINDKVLVRALERSIEIIGEAANKVDDEFKKVYPHIEWRKMAATRNQFIHHYFGIDYDIFWDIIENKIPDLHFFIKEILDEHSAK